MVTSCHELVEIFMKIR